MTLEQAIAMVKAAGYRVTKLKAKKEKRDGVRLAK